MLYNYLKERTMKAYDDPTCKCQKIIDAINKKHPEADWNYDIACKLWRRLARDLKDNKIKFDDFDDQNYGCNCPTCGNFVCGWCV
jgi:hypothetical protein